MGDTLNALLDFLGNPEANAPEDLRARVEGATDNERREARARADREAVEMEEALARERHDAARRRTRQLEVESEALRRQPPHRNSPEEAAREIAGSFNYGTGIGPWLASFMEHPGDTLRDAWNVYDNALARQGVATSERERVLAEISPPELSPGLQRFIDEARTQAEANPAASVLGSGTMSYLMASRMGVPQSEMARGVLPSLGRMGTNIGMAGLQTGLMQGAANPDVPGSFEEGFRDTVTNPLVLGLGVAGEALPATRDALRQALATRAEANANRAARLRLDSLGVSGNAQNVLAMDAEPRGALEFAQSRGMDPMEYMRGEEAGGIGRRVRDIERLINETGLSPSTQGDVLADRLVTARDAASEGMNTALGQADQQIDTARILRAIRQEAARNRALNTMPGHATADSLESLADQMEASLRTTQKVWEATYESAAPQAASRASATRSMGVQEALPEEAGVAGLLPSGDDLGGVNGATPTSQDIPTIEMQEVTRMGTAPTVTPEQLLSNRQFIDQMHQFERIPDQGAPAAREYVRNLLNSEVDDAMFRTNPELRDRFRSLSHQYSILGPDDSADGLVTMLRDRAARNPGAHLEHAIRAGAYGNPVAAATSVAGPTLFEPGRIADIRSRIARTLSDLGTEAAFTPQPERLMLQPPMATLGQAMGPGPENPGPRNDAPAPPGAPGGQPSAPPLRDPSPLSASPSSRRPSLSRFDTPVEQPPIDPAEPPAPAAPRRPSLDRFQ